MSYRGSQIYRTEARDQMCYRLSAQLAFETPVIALVNARSKATTFCAASYPAKSYRVETELQSFPEASIARVEISDVIALLTAAPASNSESYADLNIEQLQSLILSALRYGLPFNTEQCGRDCLRGLPGKELTALCASCRNEDSYQGGRASTLQASLPLSNDCLLANWKQCNVKGRNWRRSCWSRCRICRSLCCCAAIPSFSVSHTTSESLPSHFGRHVLR